MIFLTCTWHYLKWGDIETTLLNTWCRCPGSHWPEVWNITPRGSGCISGFPCSRWQILDNEWMRQTSQVKQGEGVERGNPTLLGCWRSPFKPGYKPQGGRWTVSPTSNRVWPWRWILVLIVYILLKVGVYCITGAHTGGGAWCKDSPPPVVCWPLITPPP